MKRAVISAIVVSALAACSSGGSSGGTGATGGAAGSGGVAGSGNGGVGASGGVGANGGVGATGGVGASGGVGGATGGAAGAAGAAGVAGSSGVGGSGGVGPGPNRTIEEYCQLDADIAKPWCDYATQCCSQADQDDVYFAMPACTFGPDDPADCVAFVNARIADGSIVYDGTWADACIAKQKAFIPTPPSTCDGLPGTQMALYGHGAPSIFQIPECRNVLKGLVQQGATCDYEVQCADGLICDDDGSGTYVCKPVGTLGSSCISNGDCDDSLVCNAKLKQCSTLAGVGAACLYGDECQDGLICASQKCATPIPLGGSCAGVFGGCAPGTGCSFSTSKCVSLQSNGATCSLTGECLGRCNTSLSQCVSICGGDRY